MRKVLSALFIACLFLAGGFVVRAQEAARAELSAVHSGAFPSISALLDVYDAQGAFVTGLDAASVNAIEDGQPRPLAELTEQQPGVQLVVAVNPGPPMGKRDNLGVSRYEKVVEALGGWAEARPADSPDDLSLVTTGGPLLTHAATGEWASSFVSFQPEARTATPSLQSLAFALDTVESPTPQPGMKRSILFLTPHLSDQVAVDELENLTTRAIQSGVRINVWLIDAETYFFHFSAVALKSLALQTGGQYFAFSGTEPFPDPETYLAPLRHVYVLKYDSRATTAGDHTLAVQVQIGGMQVVSLEQTFAVDVQPPNPMLVSPPQQVLRQPLPESPYDLETLTPAQQEIEILVEFPDGHPRPLARTALFVDGQMVAENVSEPFELFVWDVSGYTLNGEHSLQVEAEDSLGLRKTSLGVPVTVTIVRPPTGVQALLARNSQALTIGAVVLAGVLLVLILLRGGRASGSIFAARRRARQLYEDPVTQPVSIRSVRAAGVKRSTQPRWTRRQKAVTAPAYLVRLTSDNEPAPGKPIPLASSEMTFGTDPVRATHVLDDPSVSPLHARLRQSDDGVFTLSDQDSVAGTWVNLQPIGREGRRLVHGDVIHFGRLHYRFTLRTPPEPAKPQVDTEEPAL